MNPARSVAPTLRVLLTAFMLALGIALLATTAEASNAARTPEEDVSILIAQGRYAAAERLALAELRRDTATEGARSLRVALWQNRLGQIAQLEGRYQQALDRFRLAHDIRRARLGPTHGDTLIAAGNMSLVLARLGRWREAEPMMRETLAGNRRLLGDTHPRTVTNMTNLGLLCLDLGRQQEARTLLEEALAATRKVRQPRSDNLATSLSNLAALYLTDMDYGKAEPLLDEALALDEARHGREHPAVSVTLNNLGQLYHATGRQAEAMQAYQRARAIDAKFFSAGNPVAAGTLINLATLHRDNGDLQTARKFLAEALALTAREDATTGEPDILAMATLADLLSADGRHDEAQALLWKTISGIEARLGAGHPATAPLLMQLAATQFTTRSNPRTLAFKAHEIISRTHGIDSARAARSALEVTRILIRSGNMEDALTWASQARTQVAVHFGTASFDHAIAQQLYATAAFGVGRHNEAQVALASALPALEQVLPAQAESVADAMLLMAKILHARNDHRGALAQARKASRIITDLTRHDRLRIRLARGLHNDSIMRQVNSQVLRSALQAAETDDNANREEAIATAFMMADSLLSRPLQQAIARGILKTDLMAGEPRRLLGLLETRLAGQRQREARYAHALASGSPATDITTLRDELRAQLREVSAADRALRDNPVYRRYLTAPTPGLDAARKALRDDELLVMIVPVDNEHIVLAASRHDLGWHRVAITQDAMAREVDALRAQLDPARWKSTMSPFSRARAYRLYQSLFGPLKDMMRASNRLVLHVGGPLRSLPLATLVTRPVLESDRADSAPANLRETAWLIRSHTISNYPSLSAFVALRARKPVAAGKAWAVAGIGAPDTPTGLKLAPLPQARQELETLKKLGQATLLMGAAATEDRLRALDLSSTRILAFATHALTQDGPQGEPALVLAASPGTDGRLTPAEIAQLELRGSFVVLSACNTAGNGAGGTEQLAEAFFRAGAGAVMHTHWPVFDRRAAGLSASAMAIYRKAPQDGQAGALRKAMLGILADRSHPLNAHPSTWAAFSVVGEVLAQ
jgi:CHAT domain-containing protein